MALGFSVLIYGGVYAADYFFDADNQPWYTIMTPRAVYYNGKTYIAFQHTSMDPFVISYDHDTKSWSDAVKVGTSDIEDTDSHGNPVLWVDTNSYLYVTFGGHGLTHNGIQKVVRSVNPEDISLWKYIPAFEPKCTYPQVHRTTGNELLLFYRNGVHSIPEQWSDPWVIQTSADGGNTWSEKTEVTKHGDGDLYAMTAVGSDGVLHVTIVWESKPNIGRQDVYYIYRMGNKWYNQFNAELPAPLGLTILNDRNCKIYDTGDDMTTHVPDMKLDVGNNLYLGICDTGAGNFVFAKRIGNSEFNFTTIADGCNHWHNSAVLDIASPEEISAYINAHGPDSQGGRVEQWRTIDGGDSWSKIGDITSFADAYSMQLVQNRHPDARLVFERASDHTLYLYGDSGFVGNQTLGKPHTSLHDGSQK
jgi:hypothetical protein